MILAPIAGVPVTAAGSCRPLTLADYRRRVDLDRLSDPGQAGAADRAGHGHVADVREGGAGNAAGILSRPAGRPGGVLGGVRETLRRAGGEVRQGRERPLAGPALLGHPRGAGNVPQRVAGHRAARVPRRG